MALVTPRQFVERNPGIPMGALRLYLGFRETNGLAACGAVIQNGRSILLDEERTIEWIRTDQQRWDRRTDRASRPKTGEKRGGPKSEVPA